MLIVTLCNLRPGKEHEAPRRRLGWTPPKGVKIVGEYWLPAVSPAVVFVSEGDDLTQVFEGFFEWNDVFEMTSYPAITGKEGMELSRKFIAAHEKEGVLVGA